MTHIIYIYLFSIILSILFSFSNAFSFSVKSVFYNNKIGNKKPIKTTGFISNDAKNIKIYLKYI